MSRGADLLILIFDKDRLSYLDHAAMYHGEVFETLVGSGAGKFIPRTEWNEETVRAVPIKIQRKMGLECTIVDATMNMGSLILVQSII